MHTAIQDFELRSTREVLDFLSRHLSNRHIKALSEVTGLNSANVYASLAGRRPLPIDTAQRLANATGLEVDQEADGGIRLSVKPDRVLNFDVALEELPKLGRVIHSLSDQAIPAGHRAWWLVSALWATNRVDSQETPGVYAAAITHLRTSFTTPNSYAVVNIHWPSTTSARDVGIRPHLLLEHLGELRSSGRKPIVLPVDNSIWIQVRSGFLSVRNIDELLNIPKQESEPTGADWAQLLMTVSEQGLSPGDVISNLSVIGQRFSK